METSAQRRARQNRALVAQHPRWRGIRHPELLVLPPVRFSRLDMLPAVERGRAAAGPPLDRHAAWERRAAESAAVVEAHPRWHGVRHPERLTLTRPPDERAAWRLYRYAVRRALARLQESETLCARIDAVAAGIEHRGWGWSTNPSAALPAKPPSPPREHPLHAEAPPSRAQPRRRPGTTPVRV